MQSFFLSLEWVRQNPEGLHQYLRDRNFHRVYVPLQLTPTKWSLIVFDNRDQHMWLIDPWKNEIHSGLALQCIREVVPDLGEPWTTLTTMPNSLFEAVDNDADSGVYVIMFLYFAVHDCPIFFSRGDTVAMRIGIGHAILVNYVPV